MKDPLQMTDTPYEILGLSITADKKAIYTAFKISIAQGGDPGIKSEAHKTLIGPIERAFVDIFLYNEVYLNQLVPRVWENDIQLIEKRKEVAQAWNNIMKNSFPQFGYIHSLAVLWYWWAIYCEEEQWARYNGTAFKKKENISMSPSLSDLWSNVISHWVYLIKSDDFWNDWIQSKGNNKFYLNIKDDIEALRQKLESHFINKYHNLGERYRTKSDMASAWRYKKYALDFSTEMKTAKRLYDVGAELQINEGGKIFRICCGKIMLKQIGVLGSIRKQLDEIIIENPEIGDLKDIDVGLSDLNNIAEMIQNMEFDEAIRNIKALPCEKQREKKVLHLLAGAYLEKGKKHFSLNQFREALDCWKNGLNTGESRTEITHAIISHCKTRAVSLQTSDPDTSIKILEMGLGIISDVTLKKILSVLYCERGISRINISQKKNKDGIYEIKDVENGVHDLKKAAELDVSNTHARDQLKNAEDLLANLLAGKSNAEAVELVNRALEINKTGNLSIANDLLREAEKKIEDALMKDPYNSTYKSNLSQIKEIIKNIRSQSSYSDNYSKISIFDSMKEWIDNNRSWFWLALISILLFIWGLSK